jgi:hypothetical protein
MRIALPLAAVAASLALLGASTSVEAETHAGALGDEPECTHNPMAPKCVIAEVFRLAQVCRPICPPPPVNTTSPTVSGDPRDGKFLTATRGSWANDPQVYAVEWQRCQSPGVGCQSIPGQHDMAYQLRTEDIGSVIRVSVTAGNGGGLSMPAYSNAVGPIAPGPPVRATDPAILGAPVEGQTLRATDGVWRGTPPMTFAYQWLRCDPDGTACGAIAGATGGSYTLTTDEVGTAIRARVTASNAQGSSSADSSPTRPVESLIPPAPPSGEDDQVDDETSMFAGSWVGLDGEAALQLQAGEITLEQALAQSELAGRPPYHCSARIGWKVGGVTTIHTEGPDPKLRTVRWSGTTTCTGGQQAVFMFGYSFLDRLDGNVWRRYADGSSYSDVPDPPIMKEGTRGKAFEPPRRKPKRVQWKANIELPPPYQWANEDPLGDMRGVNEERSDCDLYSAVAEGTGPRYLNGLDCRLYGHRFR